MSDQQQAWDIYVLLLDKLGDRKAPIDAPKPTWYIMGG